MNAVCERVIGTLRRELLNRGCLPQPMATARGSSPPTPPAWFTRDQAITALTDAERLAVGYGDDDPFVKTWREELCL